MLVLVSSTEYGIEAGLPFLFRPNALVSTFTQQRPMYRQQPSKLVLG
jgi:hypothetical protein